MSALAHDAPAVEYRPMLTITRAVDQYLGELTRRGRSDATIRSYGQVLDAFLATLPQDSAVSEVGAEDVRRFFDRRPTRVRRYSQGSLGLRFTVCKGFFDWLYRSRLVARHPMEYMDPPRRLRPEDLNVLTIATADVPALLRACELPLPGEPRTWTEALCLSLLAYLGPRRAAAARLRICDYDPMRKRLRFLEKGGKTIWKPVPDGLATILDQALAAGIYADPGDYLIPSEGTTLRQERDSRLIWRVVKRVAERAGVEAHVHALRGACATHLAESGVTQEAVQYLLGHENPATTQVYFRRLNKEVVMEPVRGVTWA